MRLTRERHHAAGASGIGGQVALWELEEDPHRLFARLRESEPVSWIDPLDGWLVTRYDLALAVVRDPDTFTVEDPRFSTGQIVGPSMLSLDGEPHARHRTPFTAPFRSNAVRARFSAAVQAEAEMLIGSLAKRSGGELRRAFAGPLAARMVSRSLGLSTNEVASLLLWYDAIVAGVTRITAGDPIPDSASRAFAALSERLKRVIGDPERDSLLAAAASDGSLTEREVISNAAVLLFGGIETTEGMICNAILGLLSHPAALACVRTEPALLDRAIEESLRLEPAAAVVDRYATRNAELAGANISAGDLVRVSIAAANRDPSLFPDPDTYSLDRANHRRHLAFAHGPHVCLGVHLARLETRVAVSKLLNAFPDIRADPDRVQRVRGLVFRKPVTLYALW